MKQTVIEEERKINLSFIFIYKGKSDTDHQT